ncbi:uncharacterized protein LOC122007203 isoform X1 [Zingiber officinale]|nr:uncharacterized protein LOC122007203 isoform X1 [Zingiber officinale]
MNITEEVDQLLDKTHSEMHALIQSGGVSPKPIDGPTNSRQLKSVSDSLNNAGSSLQSHSKAKRRDKIDQGTYIIKRECPSKQDGNSSNFKAGNMVKMEIVKITDKGGLGTTDGVEKLVNLMHLDKTEKTMDVTVRALVADVITATQRHDCLIRFVQLRGLLILDEWLQEVHKSKTNDGNSPKESDKTVEELLLALLRALAKLPVNLSALQNCNIGKSVNNLRSHKNLEIQKRARGLIDTWKKRVDAEMTKINDAKVTTSSQTVWQVKPGSSELSQAGNKRIVAPEVAMKNSDSQTWSDKPGHLDASVESSSVLKGSFQDGSTSVISSAVGLKDPFCKVATNTNTASIDMLPVAVNENSSSIQSQNNSQTCSIDHRNTVGSSRMEDSKSSNVGSLNAAKAAGSSTHHRRSGNVVAGTLVSGVQKETHLVKSGSLNRAKTLEKSSQSSVRCEKSIDMLIPDHGNNNHRLNVNLSNSVQSPARSTNGGSTEDPTGTSGRASSPSSSDKYEHSHRKVKLRSDPHQSNISTDSNKESQKNNDVHELPFEARCLRSSGGDEQTRGAKEKDIESVRATSSPSGNEKMISSSEPRTKSSFSSMNALVESCIKYSEASTPKVSEDDIGMNLLASVAAGEISKSNLNYHNIVSPEASLALGDISIEDKLRLSSDEDIAHCPKSRLGDGDAMQRHVHSDESVDTSFNKQDNCVDIIFNKDVACNNETVLHGNNETTLSAQDSKLTNRQDDQFYASIQSHKSEDLCSNSEKKLEGEKDGTFSEYMSCDVLKQDIGETSQLEEKLIEDREVLEHHTDFKLTERSLLAEKSKPDDYTCQTINNNTCSSEVPPKDECQLENAVSGCEESEKLVGSECQSHTAAKEMVEIGTSYDLKQPLQGSKVVISSDTPDVLFPENHDKSRTCMVDNMECSDMELNGNDENNKPILSNIDESVREPTISNCTVGAINDNKTEESHENSMGLAKQVEPSSCMSQETEHLSKPADSLLSEAIEGAKDYGSSPTKTSCVVMSASDSASKLDFDLNEGVIADDGYQGETAISVATDTSSTIHLPILSPFTSPMSNCSPAQITVAAPAKGPFIPPENLLKNKGETGWKGSAATSAFRRAESRKAMEMTLNSSESSPSQSAGKPSYTLLDIDLNEPDERILEDVVCNSFESRGTQLGTASNLDATPHNFERLEFDLNRVDEDTENCHALVSTSRIQDVPLLANGPASTELQHTKANMLRNFDLNNGPGVDEVTAESLTRSQNLKSASGLPFLFPVSNIRMNTNELSASSWFPSGSPYPAVAIPSFLSNREQPYPLVAASGAQRTFEPNTPSGLFGGDLYRGPVVSSALPMGFSPPAFPYAECTIGPNFPISAASFSSGVATFADYSSSAGSGFPAMPLPLGSAGIVLSNYQRPNVAVLAEGSNSGGSFNPPRWITPNLDLNAGPGNIDVEGKDERLTLASRHLLAATSQGFSDEQLRMHSVPAWGLKRKEPEGGWEADRSAHKQLSWR